MYQKMTVIFSVVLVFIAIQQTFAANSSAEAARSSANSANDAQKQATYIHLANLWYSIKQKGLENSEFIEPKYSSLYRPQEVHGKYQNYHVYAWLCWGHAEDCFANEFHGDPGFKPSITNYKELHYAWLSEPKNRAMFTKDFINWVNNKIKSPLVEVKNQGTLQGKGVFAAQDFLEGEFIGFFDGQEVPYRTSMSLQFGPDLHIEPSDDTPFRNLNHSCDANAFFRGRNLYAFKKIFKNQEITIDYNCREFKLAAPFMCNCKTKACLRKIKGYKFLSTYEREIRSEMVPDWLKKMDETENAAPSS
ncbi:MAG: SET domain-containing protein [Candidatus Heimdallarchaeota archaeon]|nr:SET domain-containing protein [Candidatus Heimdallarchaeota archaeon]